jgi:hypothetical protein
VQAPSFVPPNWPFQTLPPPNGASPFRYDLSSLLSADDVNAIVAAGTMVVHTVGDTGDYRGQQQDFVAALLTADANDLPVGRKPAFFYHLGDIVYFAGDIDKYGANFYETYKTIRASSSRFQAIMIASPTTRKMGRSIPTRSLLTAGRTISCRPIRVSSDRS